MTDMPVDPVTYRAREISCRNRYGLALEAGIMSGHCDEGTIVTDYLEEAELELLRERDENNPDD